MFKRYMEPTTQNTDVVLDVANLSVEQIAQKILEDL